VINNPANPNEFITSQVVSTNLRKVVPLSQGLNASEDDVEEICVEKSEVQLKKDALPKCEQEDCKGK